MKIKQKILSSLFILVACASFVAQLPSDVHAADSTCGGVKTSIVTCTQKADGKSPQETGVWGVLLLALNIMTAGVGILAVGGITYASILYASSSDNAEQTKQAKQIIKNVAIGLAAYAGMYLLLNFLVPGGIFT
jgi:hypothetical protein